MSTPNWARKAPDDMPEPPPAPRAPWRKWRRCWLGIEPAESLPVRDREDLIYHLHRAGWDVFAIAAHTRMSTYTTGRLLDRLGESGRQYATH